ncbi:hypothetical protein [Ktedonobacter racemifer]|uniref:Uncharacterized protein n=1 Tax=Ktedonobacter racemifer DSM 44963 TaxID=485913 RepID=D6TSV2_KTERA|nr:hypothetical protein [Ktedonobacter racemifer]EFH83503.1 hypothetical protein Krac_4471 [Ktedonobacter racemifer DSM 44963]
MSLRKYTLLYSMAFVLLLFLAACGGTASGDNSSSSSTTTPQSNAVTPTSTSGGYGNGSGGNSGGTSGAVIKTASATVESKTVTILTDAKGMRCIISPLLALQRLSSFYLINISYSYEQVDNTSTRPPEAKVISMDMANVQFSNRTQNSP